MCDVIAFVVTAVNSPEKLCFAWRSSRGVPRSFRNTSPFLPGCRSSKSLERGSGSVENTVSVLLINSAVRAGENERWGGGNLVVQSKACTVAAHSTRRWHAQTQTEDRQTGEGMDGWTDGRTRAHTHARTSSLGVALSAPLSEREPGRATT